MDRNIKGKFKKGHTIGFKKGYTPWNKGKKCPNISKALKGGTHTGDVVKQRNETRKKKGEWHSEETKQKISKALIKSEITRNTYRKYKRKSCAMCGDKGKLWVHHKDGNRNNNEINNLMTICPSCHLYIHKPNKGGNNGYK